MAIQTGQLCLDGYAPKFLYSVPVPAFSFTVLVFLECPQHNFPGLITSQIKSIFNDYTVSHSKLLLAFSSNAIKHKTSHFQHPT